MNDHITAMLLRALENMLALVPDARITGACRLIAAEVIQEARDAVMLARGQNDA